MAHVAPPSVSEVGFYALRLVTNLLNTGSLAPAVAALEEGDDKAACLFEEVFELHWFNALLAARTVKARAVIGHVHDLLFDCFGFFTPWIAPETGFFFFSFFCGFFLLFSFCLIKFLADVDG